IGGQSPTHAGGPGSTGPYGNAAQPGGPDDRRRSKNRTPLLIGGAIVAVGAILATALTLSSGGDDKNTAAGTAATATATAPAAAGTLPASAQPLGEDRIVYTAKKNGNYDLYSAAVPASGLITDVKRITSTPGNEVLPVIRPGRKTVVYFTKDSDGANRYMAIAADGKSKPVSLFATGEAANLTIPNDSRPSFSPDGGSVVTRSTTDGTSGPIPGLYTVNLKTSKVSQIKNAAAQATDPAWSPSGDKIAYWANATGGDRGFIVIIGPQDGAQPIRLTEGQGNGDSDPAWSPDGGKIAFSRAAGGDLEIFEMNSDGSSIQQLTQAKGDDQDPTFAADGQLVFSAQREGEGKQLHVLNPQDPAATDHAITTGGDQPAHVRWNAG
ncbi:TolB family protein, partial [Frankia sp. AgKG'84/4]|uniref:TolB family protein n=1 Tax=Frankia sp. AgKG'84/4 TaxID=573490 RepID=UPI0035AF3264|nr:serine/threonine protein kinase [Frankia sp. AgKG'84/4]